MPKYKWTKTKSPGIYEYEITKEKNMQCDQHI